MSTEVDAMAALEETAPRDTGAHVGAPVFVVRRESASNDGTYAQPAINGYRTEAWARSALATNGCGDVATADVVPSARPTSYELYLVARAPRSFILGEIIVAMLQAIGAVARRAYARHRQRRQATAIYNALSELNDRTLRDLGLYRGELKSIAAEMSGEAACTRVRALATKHAALVLQDNSPFAPPGVALCRPSNKPQSPRVLQ